MVLISHRFKFIYFKNHKVAGSSVESFFGRFCCDPNAEYEYSDKIDGYVSEFGIMSSRNKGKIVDDWWMRIPAPHVKHRLGDDMFDEYYKFAVVRNPWDLMVSKYYWDMRLKDPPSVSFTEYITKKQELETWTSWNVHTIDGKPACDYYIRFEKLKEGIAHVCNHLGIEADLNLLPHHKKRKGGSRAHYSTFYTDLTKDIVAEVFKEHIELFEYKFESEK